MGRAREHKDRGSLSGRTKELHAVFFGASRKCQHGGKVLSLHSDGIKNLCSAILDYIGSPGPDMPPRVCNLKQLQDHLTVRWVGAEVEESAVHVSVTALESVGAVIRVGYGPDALYTLESQCFISQTLQGPEGPGGEIHAAEHTASHHAPVAVHVIESKVDVRVPLLHLDRGFRKPAGHQRETRSKKGTPGPKGL